MHAPKASGASKPKPKSSSSLRTGLKGSSKLTTEVGHLLGASAPSAGNKVPRKDSRYQLKDEIGRGGFGVVCLAVDGRTGSQVVVKQVPLLPMKKQALDLVTGEVQLMQSLQHPNVVRYLDVYLSEDKNGMALNIVMELLRGGSLRKRMCKHLKAKEPLREEQVWRWAIHALKGLHYLHSQRILHRDLTPENLLLSDTSDDATVKLCDLGLATVRSNVASSRQGSYGQMGTLGYMAAEVCESKYVGGYSEKSDVFALGVVLYEMLALNRHPFDAESWDGIIERIVDGRFPRLLARGYSDDLKHLCYKMLARELSSRPSTGNIWSMAIVREKARLLGIEIPVGESNGREGIWDLTTWEGEFYNEVEEATKKRKEEVASHVRTSAATDKWKRAGQQDGIDALLSLAGGGPMKEMAAAPPRHKAASSINRASKTDLPLPPPPCARDTGIFTPQFALRRANSQKTRAAGQQPLATASKKKAQLSNGKTANPVKNPPVKRTKPQQSIAGQGRAPAGLYFGKMDL